MKYLGLDLGTKTLGLSKSYLTIATPYKTLFYSDINVLIDELISIIKEERIDELVIGLPKNMNNTSGPATENIYNFTDLLRNKLDIKIHYEDERLTSVVANKMLSDTKANIKKKKKLVDNVAATLILQSFLDRR